MYEWRTRVSLRVHAKTGCPACAGRVATPQNSLAALFPAIAKEWHPKRNGKLRPEAVVTRSGRRVWWLCSECHEWAAPVYNRTLSKSGCPTCAGQRPTPETSLEARRPDLLASWHPTRNSRFTPADVMPGSHRKIWWICDCGYEWQARVKDRSRSGCGACAGKVVTPANNLLARNPRVSAEWHPTKNRERLPKDFYWRSSSRAWWRCSQCAHEWQSIVESRTRIGAGCPACSGRAPTPVRNLLVCHPKLAKEWHPTKNLVLPHEVSPRSAKNAWWRCGNGHEYQAKPANRVAGTGCPVCAGKLASADKNLAVEFPLIAREWHPTRNGDKRPDTIVAGSSVKAWWKCESGHVYRARISHRTGSMSGCPQCQTYKGEEFVRQTFERIFRVRFPSTRPAWLRNKRCLELDGYNEQLGLAFEHQGIQHYQVSPPFSNTPAELARQQDRDQLKASLCAEKGVRLFVVPEIPRLTAVEAVGDVIAAESKRLGVQLPASFPSSLLGSEHLAVSRCHGSKNSI